MNKITLKTFIFFFALSFGLSNVNAQHEIHRGKVKVAILAPLYLDSAFSGSAYKLQGNSIPKYILPGLDFYHGIMTAIDSLKKENTPIDVAIYDTKKVGKGINSILAEIKADSSTLIIAAFNNASEQKAVSDFSFAENIPVLSATYPNDANLTGNPFFVMLNSTISTHINAIYDYARRNYSRYKIIYVTRNGGFETRIKSQFDNLNKNKGLVYKTINLSDTFDPAALLYSMDSTKQNLVICGSLDDVFGLNIVRTISAAKSYRTTVLGMPTWESNDSFNNPDCNGVEFVFTTPYNYSRTDNIGQYMTAVYRRDHFGRPTDMYFKGFESMYHFSKLLVKYRTNILNNISDPSFKISTDFYFEPVRLTKESYAPDYIENKKIYFVKKQDGMVKAVN
ncbi:ABC transporter substrate-binding protein [Danxiaibacter flavus]|uniref:ABC transporter substrate-binding protein n=1 Tax=Danxiaibacter flavus TaxID=3049108 RepID=A0ABV3ZJR6_9BACT|nr:ABC transporter substrate-binding protein [Chitinophagaceae bacterium DXS]